MMTNTFRVKVSSDFSNSKSKAKTPVVEMTMNQLEEHRQANFHLYEVLHGHVHPYYDFERDYTSEPEYEQERDNLILDAFQAVSALYPEASVMTFGACGYSQEKNKYRVSAHFVVAGAGYFERTQDCLSSAQLLDKQIPGFDLGVYTTNRLFRMPYCSKSTDPTRVLQRLYVTSDGVEQLDECQSLDILGEEFSSWLITNVYGDAIHVSSQAVIERVAPVEATGSAYPPLTVEQIRCYITALASHRATQRDSWCKGIWACQSLGIQQGMVQELKMIAREFAKQTTQNNYSQASTDDLYDRAPRSGDVSVGFGTIIKWAREDTPDLVIAAGLSDDAFVIEPTDEFDYTLIEAKIKLVKTAAYLVQFEAATTRYMNKYYTLIKSLPDSFIIYEGRIKLADGTYEAHRYYRTDKTMKTDFKNKSMSYQIGDKPVKFCAYDCWNTHRERNEKDRVMFQPRILEDAVMYADSKAYNLFDKLAISREDCRDAADLGSDCPMLKHIMTRWCGNQPALNDFVLNVFALQVQKPWIKHRMALVLKSCEGAGKGIVMNMLAEIIGKKYICFPSKPDDILGNFNGILEGKFIAMIDEMTWGGDKQKEGILKKLITEVELRVNRKGIEAYTIDSPCNSIITSNEDWIVPAGKKSRRWQMIELNDELAGVKTPKIAAIIKDIRAVDPRSFAKFLYARDISSFDPTAIVSNSCLREQKIQSMSPMDKICLEMINTGSVCFNGQRRTISQAEFNKSDFFDQIGSGMKHINATKFWIDMRKLFPSITFVRKTVQGIRAFAVEFPHVDTMRNEFREMFNEPEWEFDTADEVADDQ